MIRVLLRVLLGAIAGLLFPYAVALINIFPFLNRETNYEVAMSFMFFSAIIGALIPIAIEIAHRYYKFRR